MRILVVTIYFIFWTRYYFFPIEELSLWQEMEKMDEVFWIEDEYNAI